MINLKVEKFLLAKINMWRVNKATEILCGRPLNPSQKLVLVLMLPSHSTIRIKILVLVAQLGCSQRLWCLMPRFRAHL